LEAALLSRWSRVSAALLLAIGVGSPLAATPQLAPTSLLTVTGTVTVAGNADRSGAVVWLTPLSQTAPKESAASGQRFKIIQKGKRFSPQVLAVPAGSVVDFPNLDPILHNVFSLFDGRRFDLGLYESGSTKSVTFRNPGVSYIFCNIHPEMSAVVIAVDSPYFATSTRNGAIAIADVPPGRYRLSVWHDRFKTEAAGAFPREVTIAAGSASLGSLALIDNGETLAVHKNKFGHDYTPPSSPKPYAR
jgi:plastocyanin